MIRQPKLALLSMLLLLPTLWLSAAPTARGASEEARLTPSAALVQLLGPVSGTGGNSLSGQGTDRATEPSAGQLLEAAILFSEPDGTRAESTRQAILLAMEEAVGLAGKYDTDYELGEAVLALVHERFFTRYVEAESRLDAAVLDGRYNCVSSSALYLILARAARLDVGGVITKDHSFCVIQTPDRAIDVETTNPFGFDPGSKKEFQDSFGRVTGYSYVPPSDYRSREKVDGRHLMALILWNRATLLERGGQWAQAVGLAVDAYAYSPDPGSRRQLEDRLYNNAGALLNEKRWREALSFLERAIRLYGPSARLEGLAGQARLAILADELELMDPRSGLAAISEAWEQGLVDRKHRDELLAYAYGRLAEDERAVGGWFAAWDILKQGTASAPQSSQLARMAETARKNWTYEVHNRFASLFNDGNYREALAVIEEALTILPGERLFRDDAATARKAIKP
jgi:tetratricopeptide (TPR) repeat protein